MTSFHGKGVREQIRLYVRPSSIYAINNISTERGDLWLRAINCIYRYTSYRTIYNFCGTVTLYGKATVVDLSCFPSKNGVYFKRKRFTHLGSKFFPLKADPFCSPWQHILMSPNLREGDILILMRILLASVLVLASAWHFLSCKISSERVVEFFPNFHGYSVGT